MLTPRHRRSMRQCINYTITLNSCNHSPVRVDGVRVANVKNNDAALIERVA